MIFKRPKTTNNFWFYYSGISAEDESCEQQRAEKDFDLDWYGVLQDPIYFWYLLQIFEHYQNEKDDTTLSLGNILKVEGYRTNVIPFDEAVWNEWSLWDYLFMFDAKSLILCRIANLTQLFFAFDITEVFIGRYLDDIGRDIIRNFLTRSENPLSISDDTIDDLYCVLWELGRLDEFLTSRAIIKYHHVQELKEERSFDWDKSYISFFPKYLWKPLKGNDLWQKLSYFGEYIHVRLEFDTWNMWKLQKLIDAHISDSFEKLDGIESVARKFIALAKKSEIIGNTVFMKFGDIVNADFACFQYMYWLDKIDDISVESWNIEDVFVVKIYSDTIAHILGMGPESEKQKENIGNISYNQEREVLELNWRKIALWETNEGFIKEYFDLMFHIDSGVWIDEIVERLEPNIWELKNDEMRKRKKSLSYDRVKLLNGKIAKLTWVTGLFKIGNGYIKLTSAIRVEK